VKDQVLDRLIRDDVVAPEVPLNDNMELNEVDDNVDNIRPVAATTLTGMCSRQNVSRTRDRN